jgi:hypothetical protein
MEIRPSTFVVPLRAAFSPRKKKKPKAPLPKYSEHVVAFVDFLGSRDLVMRTKSSKLLRERSSAAMRSEPRRTAFNTR